jgi:hypothetical protein
MTDSYTQFKNPKKMRYEVAVSLLDVEESKRAWRRKLFCEKYISLWQFKVVIALLELIDEEEFARNGELRPMTPISSPAKMFGCGEPFIRQVNADLTARGILRDQSDAREYEVVFEKKYLRDPNLDFSNY